VNDFALSGSSAQEITAANFSPGTAVGVIDFNATPMGCLDPTKPNRRHGMCSIHIDEWDVTRVRDSGAVTNQYLVADVKYATEGRGGEFSVGITRGTILAVGGVDVISVKAYFQRARLEEELLIEFTKRVQATITWSTSISPKEAKFSLPGVLATNLDGVAVPTAWFRIPRQAESMLIQTDNPAALPGLFADFANSDAAGSILFSTLDPNANGSLIEGGVEFVRFRSPTLMRVTPTFSIWP
jgi:hypothetical protein